MNFMQKHTISELREKGFSYAKIAEALKLSENSVKSYCQRNNLGGAKTTDEKLNTKLCAQCAKPIFAVNKSKRFCSSKCRTAWWNTHAEKHNTAKMKTVVCTCCGKTFFCYICRPRKYCSHGCYISARFKRENTSGEGGVAE